MPRKRVNGEHLATDATIKDEPVSTPTTPRRSKRKLETAIPEPSPRSVKQSKTEVNGKVKATASPTLESQSPATASPKQPNSLLKRAKDLVTKVVDGDNTKGQKGTSKVKKEDLETRDIENGDEEAAKTINQEPEKKQKSKRKTKEEKEAEMLPLASRTAGLQMYVGAHVSMAGGLENSVKNSVRIGGNAFALFLRSQKKWDNPPLKDETRDMFRAFAKEHDYDVSKFTLPHGSYLVNLAIEDAAKAKQSYDVFVDDLHRCDALGIKLYNFHPGHYSQSTLEDGMRRIAKQLNRAISETKEAIPVLENAAGSGTVIGSKFSDLAGIINDISPEYRDRVGVCIDTCHAFAAGYDLRDPESFKAVLEDFDKTVGMKYLKALHLNDSKAPIDSKRDLHQNIGLGFLGLRAFHNVMNEPRFQGLPLILETPCDVPDPSDPKGKRTKQDLGIWAREIKLLESLIGMDPDSTEFKTLEAELSEKGRKEREEMQKMQEKKVEKAKKALEKGQKSLKDMFGSRGRGAAATPAKGKGKKKSKKDDDDDDSDLSSCGSDHED